MDNNNHAVVSHAAAERGRVVLLCQEHLDAADRVSRWHGTTVSNDLGTWTPAFVNAYRSTKPMIDLARPSRT